MVCEVRVPIVGIYRWREVAEGAARARPWRGFCGAPKGKARTATARQGPGDAQRVLVRTKKLRTRSSSSSHHRGTRGTSTTRTTVTRLWAVLEHV
jgi:hypothetical protein